MTGKTSGELVRTGRPPKPISAYNIFFRLECRRIREREKCRQNVISRLLVEEGNDLGGGIKKGKQSASSFIGGKWRKKGKGFKLYFELQRKEIVQSHIIGSAIFEAKNNFDCVQKTVLLVATALERHGTKQHASSADGAFPNHSSSSIFNHNANFSNL